MEKIHEFVSNLLAQRGITDLDEETKANAITEMEELLLSEIDQAAINALSEEKAIELADGLENGTIKQEDVAQFMKDAGLDLEKISFDTMMEFKDYYLGNKVVPEEVEEVNQ